MRAAMAVAVAVAVVVNVINVINVIAVVPGIAVVLFSFIVFEMVLKAFSHGGLAGREVGFPGLRHQSVHPRFTFGGVQKACLAS